MTEMKINPTFARQPDSHDPLEIRIRGLLENNLDSTAFANICFTEAKKLQEDYLREFASGEKENPNKLLDNLNLVLKTQIKGENHLDFPGSFIIVTNHLGTPKLTRIQMPDLLKGKDIEPFFIRYCGFKLIADKTGSALHETAVELPGRLRDLQEISGTVTIPVTGEGRTEKLINDVKDKLQKERSVFVMYPEGGTSGKRNSGSPYDLDEFHKGSFVVAALAGIPIVPVCQIFDPEKGLILEVLDPIKPEEMELAKIQNLMNETRQKMQNKLDEFSKQLKVLTE